MKQYITFQTKKILAFVLIIPLTISLLVGCSGEQEKAGTISDFESRTHIGVSTPDESEDTSREPLTGDFVISEKKYDYNGANLELLYIENQTNRHYDITIHGTYLDENGETIEEETQTFECFASGWSNNFIFYPRKAFDSFTYTVDMVETKGVTKIAGCPIKTVDENGIPLVSYLTEFTYEKELKWMRFTYMAINPDERYDTRGLNFSGNVFCRPVSTEIKVHFNLLILDENGEIYITNFDYRDSDYNGTNEWAIAEGLPLTEGFSAIIEGDEVWPERVILKAQDIGGDETIPDTVQGKLTAIFAVTQVYDWNEWYEHATLS